MLLLDLGHALEQLGDVVEALFPGGLGEAGVHVGPLVILAGGGVLQVVQGVADAVVEELEPDLGVLLLVVGSLLEDVGDLHVAVLLGLAGVVGVLVPGLGLPGESGHQVGLGLGAFQFWHSWFLLMVFYDLSGLSSSIQEEIGKVKRIFANNS